LTKGYYAGIDIGSWSTKSVIIDGSKNIVGHDVRRTGIDFEEAAQKSFSQAQEKAAIEKEEVHYIVATGYGRNNVDFANESRTEISCHSIGAYHYFPERITIVDIGGQDNKYITLSPEGRRVNFKMNRKCAAGTGAFLEETALKLDVPIEDFNQLAPRSTKDVKIGSYCTVFAATEMLKLIREGARKEDIIRALFISVAQRIAEMGALSGKVVLTGGVIEHNPILVDIFKEDFGVEVFVPPHPQLMGALGAALIAFDIFEKD